MERTANDRPAVVVGLDSLQGLQAARILHRHGIRVIALAGDRRHPHCRTNCVDEIDVVDTGAPALVERLLTLGAAERSRPVLVPCQDKSVRQISLHRSALDPLFAIALADQATIDTLTDKRAFLEHATSIGLAVPDYVVLDTSDDVERAVDSLAFPCIVKPSFRTPTWDRNTKHKVFVAAAPADLADVFDRCRPWADGLIAQTSIPGDDSMLASFNGYFDADGRPLATFVARKLRQWPPGAGSSCLGEEVRDDAVLDAALRLFGSVPYRGLAYLEMKRDPSSGALYAIEANVGRPTGRSAIAEAGGVELLHTMYCDLAGLPLPAGRTQTYTGTKWIDVRHDLQSAFVLWRRGDLTIADWARSYRGPKTFAVASFRDPVPFLTDIALGVRTAFAGALPRRSVSR